MSNIAATLMTYGADVGGILGGLAGLLKSARMADFSPEQLLTRASIDADLQAALDALPETFRQAFYARGLAGTAVTVPGVVVTTAGSFT